MENPLYCTGQIDDYDVNRSGGIYLDGDWNGDDQLICYLDGSWGGVSADVCKAWMLTIEAAISRSATIKVKYVDVGVGSCAELPTWGAISKAPEYIRVY